MPESKLDSSLSTGALKSVCYISCVGEVQYTRTLRILRTLRDDGYQVIAICPGNLSAQMGTDRIVHSPLPKPGTFFWYDAGLVNAVVAMWYRIKNTFLLLWKLFHFRPEVVVCSEPDAWGVACLYKMVRGGKVIADIREVYEDRSLLFPKFVRQIVKNLLRLVMRFLSKHTDEIIHVSRERQQVYSYLHRSGVVIGHYPEIALFPPRKATNTDINIIHAGALRPSYASDQFLEAIKIVSDVTPYAHFIVVGGIAGKLKNADLIESLQDTGMLSIIEQVPYSEVISALYKSSIGISLVLPVDTAHRLASPQKLYEYFAASLPVVVADIPTLRRVVMENECGLVVNASDPEDIAKAIIRLVDDTDLRKEMGQNARRVAENVFNWEKEALKLSRLMRSLA